MVPTPPLDSGFGLDAQTMQANRVWMRRLAAALVQDPAAADDLVQDAFCAAAEAPGPIENLRAYLAGTLRNLAKRGRRGDERRRLRERTSEEDRPISAPPADELAERVETLRLILEELQSLRPTWRRVLSLRFVEGMDPAAIAAAENLTVSAVRAYQSRGLTELRTRLDRRTPGTGGVGPRWQQALAPWLAGAPGAVPVAPLAPSALSPSFSLPVAVGGILMLAKFAVPALVLGVIVLGALRLRSDPQELGPPVLAGEELASELAVETAQPNQPAALAEPRTVPAKAPDLKPQEPGTTAASPAVTRYAHAGVVLDVRTQEPVPDILISRAHREKYAEPWGQGEQRFGEVWTNEAGRFDFEHMGKAGSIQMRVRDPKAGAGTEPVLVNVDVPIDTPIAVSVGPTYHLDFDLPVGMQIEQFEARFLDFEGQELFGTGAHVRPGDMPWVRFAAEVADLPGSGSWILQLQDRAGNWRGTTSCLTRQGIAPVPLVIELEQRGAIEFVPSRPEGPHPAFNVIDLIGPDGEQSHRVDLHLAEDGSLSAGLLGHLPAGTYSWTYRAGPGSSTGEVEVRVGERTRVELPIGAGGSTFTAVLTVDRTERPNLAPHDWLRIIIHSKDNLESAFTVAPGTPPPFTEDPLWRIELKDLPHGEWRVLLPDATEPDQLEVSPEVPELYVRLLPEREKVDVTVQCIDDLTGEPLPNAMAMVIHGKKGNSLVFESEGRFRPYSVPVDTELLVYARSNGYQLELVTCRPGQEGRVLEIRLRKGWRSRIAIVDIDAMQHVPDVPIQVDGEALGMTDAQGGVWYPGPDVPQRATLDLPPGWTVVHDPFADRNGIERDPLMGWVFGVRRQ